MSPLESLTQTIADAPSLERALDALLDGLAQRIKATSNDQNVQKLAREIRIVAPSLVAAVVAKREDARA